MTTDTGTRVRDIHADDITRDRRASSARRRRTSCRTTSSPACSKARDERALAARQAGADRDPGERRHLEARDDPALPGHRHDRRHGRGRAGRAHRRRLAARRDQRRRRQGLHRGLPARVDRRPPVLVAREHEGQHARRHPHRDRARRQAPHHRRAEGRRLREHEPQFQIMLPVARQGRHHRVRAATRSRSPAATRARRSSSASASAARPSTRCTWRRRRSRAPSATPSDDPETAEFERELLAKVNALGVGPQAVGGVEHRDGREHRDLPDAHHVAARRGEPAMPQRPLEARRRCRPARRVRAWLDRRAASVDAVASSRFTSASDCVPLDQRRVRRAARADQRGVPARGVAAAAAAHHAGAAARRAAGRRPSWYGGRDRGRSRWLRPHVTPRRHAYFGLLAVAPHCRDAASLRCSSREAERIARERRRTAACASTCAKESGTAAVLRVAGLPTDPRRRTATTTAAQTGGARDRARSSIMKKALR